MDTSQPFVELDNFFQNYPLLTFKKREVLFRSHERPTGVYYLKKGFVRNYAVSLNGEEFTQVIFRIHDFFPMSWAINNTKNFHTYEAMTEIEAWRAPRGEFQEFIKENPAVLFELMKRVVIRLKGTQQRIEELAFGNANHKVASILLICAERFGVKTRNGIEIQVPLIHRDIASLVGLTRETVSIEMNKLKKKGIFESSYGFVTVKNMNLLYSHSLVSPIPEEEEIR